VIREAVVLAAGRSTRLGKLGRGAKFSLKVGDKPLIYYPMKSLFSAGVEVFHVVVNPYNKSLMERVIAELGYEHVVNIVVNEEPWRENGYSFLVGAANVEDEIFFLSMSDHIYSAKVPLAIIKTAIERPDADIIVAGDAAPRYVDVEEATLIYADESLNVKQIGKGLNYWNYVDAGVFAVKKRATSVAAEISQARDVVKLSDIINEAIARGLKVVVADITGQPWTEVDTVEDYLAVNEGWKRSMLGEVMNHWSPI